VVKADFFETRLPPTYEEAKIKDAVGFRDEKARRRIQFSKVDLPAGDMDANRALDQLTEGVRQQASEASLGLTLGPIRRIGTETQPGRVFLAAAKDRRLVQGFVGRRVRGRLVAVMAIFEEDGSGGSERCVEQDGKALIESIVVLGAEAAPTTSGSASAASPAPLLRFSPAAIEELRRQVGPGETVWVGANRDGAEVSYLLDVGKQVPPDAEPIEVEGIPIAIDRGSVPMLRGTTVDFVAGRGFSFSRGP
jgi:Fe-S cluster assembly iron-binding protein IscA